MANTSPPEIKIRPYISGLCLPVKTCKCLAIRRKCENSRGMPRVDTWLREAVRKLRCGIVPVADRPVADPLRFPGIRIFSALSVFNIAENCWPQAVPTVWSTSGNCEADAVLWRFMKPLWQRVSQASFGHRMTSILLLVTRRVG